MFTTRSMTKPFTWKKFICYILYSVPNPIILLTWLFEGIPNPIVIILLHQMIKNISCSNFLQFLFFWHVPRTWLKSSEWTVKLTSFQNSFRRNCWNVSGLLNFTRRIKLIEKNKSCFELESSASANEGLKPKFNSCRIFALSGFSPLCTWTRGEPYKTLSTPKDKAKPWLPSWF